MNKLLLIFICCPLLSFGQFTQLTLDELHKGEFSLKTVTLTEKVMSGIIIDQQKEIDVTYKFHYPDKFIQLPKLNEKFQSASNPVSAYYTYLAFELVKKFEEQRKDVEGVEASIQAKRAEYMTTALVEHDKSKATLIELFEEAKKSRLEIYDLTDPEQKLRYDKWLKKETERLEGNIEKDKERKKDLYKQKYMDDKNFKISLRQISLPKYRKYKALISSLNKGLLYLGTIEFVDNNRTEFAPLFAFHDENGKFTEVKFESFIMKNNKFKKSDTKGNKIEEAEWLLLQIFGEKDLSPKMKEVLKIAKIPDLE